MWSRSSAPATFGESHEHCARSSLPIDPANKTPHVVCNDFPCSSQHSLKPHDKQLYRRGTCDAPWTMASACLVFLHACMGFSRLFELEAWNCSSKLDPSRSPVRFRPYEGLKLERPLRLTPVCHGFGMRFCVRGVQALAAVNWPRRWHIQSSRKADFSGTRVLFHVST